METKLKEIEKITKNFLKSLGIEAEIKLNEAKNENETINLEIEIKEKEFVNKECIQDIQHLLSAICKKKIDQNLKLEVDINDYKKKRIKFLKELANSLATEVALTKKEKILDPLPAFERKIIHLELSKREDVITESIGREPMRRVVIKPKI
jgi:spoIIIJ-associated protein